MSFYITIDSGTDLPIAVCKENDVIPIFMNYMIDDKIYTDTMVDEDIVEFYNREREGAVPKTSQVTPLQFVEFWKNLPDQNKEILHISMSSGISGTYKSALTAVSMLKDINPDRKIRVVDSLFTSTGTGILVLEAVKMRNDGKTAKECEDWLNKHKLEVNSFITTDNLNYLYKGGRVSKTSAIFGTALKISPIIRLDTAGTLKVFEKARGEKAAIERIIENTRKTVVSPETQTLYVSHADNIEKAKKVGELMQKEFGFKDVKYYYIGTTIGAHTGVGLIATFFFGKARKDN